MGDGDGWVSCAAGHRHWGRYGAAGLLLLHTDGVGAGWVLLQHRVQWSHHGGTWGIPGGARDSVAESPTRAALREAGEETGLDPVGPLVRDEYVDDHGGWAYTTVIADAVALFPVAATGGESLEVRWVPVAEVASLPLHPGFRASLPHLPILPGRATG